MKNNNTLEDIKDSIEDIKAKNKLKYDLDTDSVFQYYGSNSLINLGILSYIHTDKFNELVKEYLKYDIEDLAPLKYIGSGFLLLSIYKIFFLFYKIHIMGSCVNLSGSMQYKCRVDAVDDLLKKINKEKNKCNSLIVHLDKNTCIDTINNKIDKIKKEKEDLIKLYKLEDKKENMYITKTDINGNYINDNVNEIRFQLMQNILNESNLNSKDKLNKLIELENISDNVILEETNNQSDLSRIGSILKSGFESSKNLYHINKPLGFIGMAVTGAAGAVYGTLKSSNFLYHKLVDGDCSKHKDNEKDLAECKYLAVKELIARLNNEMKKCPDKKCIDSHKIKIHEYEERAKELKIDSEHIHTAGAIHTNPQIHNGVDHYNNQTHNDNNQPQHINTSQNHYTKHIDNKPNNNDKQHTEDNKSKYHKVPVDHSNPDNFNPKKYNINNYL